MPDPDYKGEFPSQEDIDKANEEQRKHVEDNKDLFSGLDNDAEESDSPTPAADLGEGGLAAGGPEGVGPSGSSDPDAAAERQENVAETGSTVSEEEVENADDDSKDEAKKPAAKRSAKK